MSEQKIFDWGMLAGMLLMVSAESAHWLITPMSHPHASSLQHTGVLLQAVICFAISFWLIRRFRPRGKAVSAASPSAAP